MQTAVALLQVALVQGRGPRIAGSHLGAWLKIAFKQSPDLFVDERLAPTKFDELRAKWMVHLRDRPYSEQLASSLDAAQDM
jgi:hypothetical protein